MSIFQGAAVALVTPFTQTSVNYEELKRMLDFQIQGQTDAIVVNGTTGEPSTMTSSEKHKVAEDSIAHVAGRVPMIVGTGGNNTQAAIAESKFAQTIGADALLVVTPYYNKCSQEGLMRHYLAIADAVDIPIIVYNVPGRTGVNIAPATLAKLAEHQNIAAIKEASGNISQIAEMARLTQGKMDIYSGNDDQIIPLMSLGGKGVISVLSNIVPSVVHEMTTAYLNGDVKKACQMQLDYNPLANALFTDVNPIPVKTALNMMGFAAGPLRLPLCEMSAPAAAKLEETLRAYKLIG
ncbi:MAG: 4-hydroxy-tetrahydrodipicolinate synthase [Christensenellaceae bacterium]|nr:4-hydroxy-tetrahydrodipicolinate synthase [Christensenellaceae bacterium]